MPSVEAMEMQKLHLSLMRPPKKAKPRFKCSGCNNRLTRNQLKAKGGKCSHCGTQVLDGR